MPICRQQKLSAWTKPLSWLVGICLFLLLINAVSGACLQPPAGLGAWWNGEVPSVDLASANSASLRGNTSATPGKVGNAFDLDAVGDYVYASDYAKSSSQLTIAAWVYCRTWQAEGTILNSPGRFHLGFLGGDGGILGLELVQGDLTKIIIMDSTPLPLYEWIQVVATADGANVRLYTNGVEVANEPYDGSINRGSSCLGIGARVSAACNSQAAEAMAGYWDGLIDEVQIWPRGLSPSEVAALYQADSEGLCAVPFIFEQPENATVLVGSTALFTVDATSASPSMIQWYSNGNLLPGKTGNLLILSNAQPVLEGLYTAVVSNQFGFATSAPARLMVDFCATPAPGLVAWWTGDNSVGDITGRFLLTPSEGIAFGTGKVGQALSFSGNNAYAGAGTSAALAPKLFTVSFWMKAYGLRSPKSSPIARWGGGSNSWAFNLMSNGRLDFLINTTEGENSAISAELLQTNQWYFVAGTWDGVKIRLYIEGWEHDYVYHSGMLAQSPSTVTLGGEYFNGVFTNAYPGMLDEVQIHNRALSENEILYLYESGSIGQCKEAPIINSPVDLSEAATGVHYSANFSTLLNVGAYEYSFAGGTLPPGLKLFDSGLLQGTPTTVGLYNFVLRVSDNDGDTRRAYSLLVTNRVEPPDDMIAWWSGDFGGQDLIHFANDAALFNGASIGPGKAGNALSLDGTNDIITCSSAQFGDSYEALTIEGWVYPNSMSYDGQVILSKTEDDGFALRVVEGYLVVNLMLDTGDVEEYFGEEPLPVGKWSHVAMTFGDGWLRTYFNGELLDRFSVAGMIRNTATPAACLMIGQEPGAIEGGCVASGTQVWDGLIDELSMYHRALGAGEILRIAQAGGAGKGKPSPLDIQIQGAGSVYKDPVKTFYPFGETVTLSAVAGANSAFTQWSDGNTDPIRTVQAGAVSSLTAVFTATAASEQHYVMEWQRSFGGEGGESFVALEPTLDGGYIAGGSSISTPSGSKASPNYGSLDYWVVKMNNAGDVEWEYSYGGNNLEILASVIPTRDGGYLVGGHSYSGISGNKTTAGFGQSDYWIVKLNAYGWKEWEKTYGGSNRDELTALKQLQDGSFLVAGHSYSTNNGNKTSAPMGFSDFWVLRLNGVGEKLWEKAFGAAGVDECAAIAEASDGSIVLAGHTDSTLGGTKEVETTAWVDWWAEIIDSNGSELDEHAVLRHLNIFTLHEQEDFVESVISLSPSYFLLAGNTRSTNFGSEGRVWQGERDFAIAMVDLENDPQAAIWEAAFGGDDEEILQDCRRVPGGFVLGGYSWSGASGNKSSLGFGRDDYWVVKTDGLGNLLWERTYGGSDYDELVQVLPTLDGGLLLGGSSNSGLDGNRTVPNYGASDFWLIKLGLLEVPVGTPLLHVNGEPVSTNFIIQGSATLSIQSTLPGAYIYYTLDGSNPAAGALYTGPFVAHGPVNLRAFAVTPDFSQSAFSPNYQLTIDAPPVVNIIAPEEVIPGEPLVLDGEASGTPPLAFQWYFEGVEIPGATEPDLTIDPVQAENQGAYELVVTNIHGVASTSAYVTVLSPPGFVTSLSDTDADLGTDVTFEVTVSGSAPFEYQWRKNGANIPDATNSTFTITNVQVADGGAYSVVVANRAGAMDSPAALLGIIVPSQAPPEDQFTQRRLLEGIKGFASGSNVGAGKEVGELNHANKPGGASVWYKWVAPYTGIATFRTQGSTFDTLLAIYTGSGVNSLELVASDEDSGGAFTSQAQFNATAGVEYQIAIDGVGLPAQEGDFILSWDFEVTPEKVPVVLTQPVSQTVSVGDNVALSITPLETGNTYQWFFNGVYLPGETNTILKITNVQPENVGVYVGWLTNAAGRGAQTRTAVIELGPFPGIYSVDKFEDVLVSEPSPSRGGIQSVANTGALLIPVSAGDINSQTLNNTEGSTQTREANHCGIICRSTRWIVLSNRTDGAQLMVDTIPNSTTGSNSLPTVLAVYTQSPTIFAPSTNLVACGVTNAPDRRKSVTKVFTGKRTNYWVVVDTVNGQQGNITINWRCGFPPTVAPQPVTTPTLERGGTLDLQVTVNSSAPPAQFQWRRNGQAIQGQTGPQFSRSGIDVADAGIYDVIVRNFAGGVTNRVAEVTVVAPALEPLRLSPNGDLELRANGSSGNSYQLQTSGDLQNWISIRTNVAENGGILFTEPKSPNPGNRFYRVIPWP